MKKISQYISTVAILALLFSACDKSHNDTETGLEITFQSSITPETRVTDDLFDKGDEISVSALDGTSSYAESVSYVYDGSIFYSTTPIYYTSVDQTLSFVATHPTIKNLDSVFSFEVSADQSTEDNFNSSDLLLATAEATGDTSPALEFQHAMASIVINNTDTSMSGGVIKILAQCSVEIDTIEEEYTTDGSVVEITPTANGSESYKAIIAPQVVKSGEIMATYEVNGVTYKWTANNDMTFKSGYRETYDWDVSSNTVTYTGSVEGWNDNTVSDNKTTYGWDELNYNQIDFDATYGTGLSGSTLTSKISTAITAAGDNDIIVFKSDSYDFSGSSLTISKSARLSGAIPSEIDGSVMGAQNLTTSFKNVERITISTSDVELYNMSIEGNNTTKYGLIYIGDSMTNQYFVKETTWREGLVFSNVQILYASAQIYAGNGAGATYKYVTFKDFASLGYVTNRTAALDVCPKSIFSYCSFEAPGEAYYDMRGISIDCGNTDYPIVLDLSETLIDHCYFYRGGIAYSKCENSKVTNCYFFSNSMSMDQVHIEEFSNNIEISYNTFHHDEPSRSIYLDRSERQTVSDITITNNKYTGEIGWIISTYSPRDITFTNNDFTQATFGWDTYYCYDLDFCHYDSDSDKVGFEYEYPSQNVVIKDNPGLSTTGGGIRIFTEIGNNTNDIDVITAADITEVPLASDSQPIKFSKCYIQNLRTGEYISYGESGSDYVGVSSDKTADCIWNVEFRDPQNYNFTTSTGLYLEAYAIYSLSNLSNYSYPGGDAENTRVRKVSYDPNGRVPSFVLQHSVDEPYTDYYIIYPGENERKSAIAIIDDKVYIGFGKVSYGNFRTDDINTGSNVYLNPADYENYLWSIVSAE